jgi:hypothetical protein
MASKKIAEIRLSLISQFQSHSVEADVHLNSIDPHGEMEFLAIANTSNVEIELLEALATVNGVAGSSLKFLGGHLNSSNVNTFLFRFSTNINDTGDGGLCG